MAVDLVSVDCPSCGASLPPREPSGSYRCDYCGSRFELRQAKSAKTQAGISISPAELARAVAQAQQRHAHDQQASHAQHYAEAAKRGRRLSWIIFTVVLAVGFVPAIVALLRSGALSSAVSSIPGAGSVPGVAAVAEATEHLLWDDVGGRPQVVTIAGKPAFIGRTRKVLDGDQLFIDAYDAATVARVWRLGPLGSYSEGYQSTLFGALAGRVVVSDFRSRVRLLDVETGAEVQTIELTDRVEYVCVPPDAEGSSVWIKQVDERAHTLDVTTGTLTESKQPKWCARDRWAAKRAREAPANRRGLPKIEGMEIQHVLEADEVSVAVGVKHPGTPIPRAAGLDQAGKQVLWNEDIPTVDVATVRSEDPLAGLGGGRVVATYGAGQDTWHITALDAKTGARLWDTTLRSLFAVDQLQSLTVTDHQALLVRTSSLEVFDTHSGTLLGTVGKETYD